MEIDTLGIPLAYLIVAAAAMWILVAVRGRWWLKGAVIFLAVVFSVALWHSLSTLQGWPVEAEMPARFEIKWLVTEEPDKQGRRPGAVFVWAVDLEPDRATRKPFFLRLHRKGEDPEPRIYRLPYSRPLHEQAREIQDKLMGGKRFFAVMKKGLPGEGGAPGSATGREGRAGGEALGEGKGRESGKGAPYAVHQDYVFHELPPPRFPEKETP
jgi:hypothetical protein